MIKETSKIILPGIAQGPIVFTNEPLSFWGGVDPKTGCVIDVHHPLCGISLKGAILAMPTSRGSCTGSGVLLDLLLSGLGPSGIIFSESEDVLTLGAIISAEMFRVCIPIIRLSREEFSEIAMSTQLSINNSCITSDIKKFDVEPAQSMHVELRLEEQNMLLGKYGNAVAQAMKIVVAMAAQQGAKKLIKVKQAHIDGCIYASPANLLFAEKMASLMGSVRVPTTMNAISVDYKNWKKQGISAEFGNAAQRLADAYVAMGCLPTFTCSPYLLENRPNYGDSIAWSESNAVIFANSILGARTPKLPDFLDLCIALTGVAPEAGVYLDENRSAEIIIDVELNGQFNDAFWPLIGYVVGKISPDQIPFITGLEKTSPTVDNLKSLCAAFGTTSASPMLHIAGITPEALNPIKSNSKMYRLSEGELEAAWESLNNGPSEVGLVAIGSPHASKEECEELANKLELACRTRSRDRNVNVIVTAGVKIIEELIHSGALEKLKNANVKVYPDFCWCSIVEPVFPLAVKSVITNSGKYAHYGPGLSKRSVRLASLDDCVEAAFTGSVAPRKFGWRLDVSFF